MTSDRRPARAFLRFTWVELRLFMRDPFAAGFALVFPIMMALLLAAVFGDTPSPDDVVDGMPVFRGVSGADYYMAATIPLMVTATALLGLPIHLASYREQGVLRRFRASGVPAWMLFGSQLALGLAVGLAGGAGLLLVAVPVSGAHQPEDLVGVLVAFLLTTLAFTALGFLLAALLRTSRAALGLALLLFFGSWILAGTGPPRAVLPEGVRRLTDLIPLTHAVIAVQDPWFGYGWNSGQLALLAALAIAAAVPALLLFRWE